MTWLSSRSKAFIATKQRLEAGLKQANEEKTRHMMEAERVKQDLTQRQRQVDLLQQVGGGKVLNLWLSRGCLMALCQADCRAVCQPGWQVSETALSCIRWKKFQFGGEMLRVVSASAGSIPCFVRYRSIPEFCSILTLQV